MEPVGAGLCPRPVFGGRWRFCRGRPACRPVVRRRFRADTWVRPYAVGEAFRNQRKFVRKRTLPTGRDGARPLRGSGAGRCVQDGGVRSPRPTGATQVVPSSGPMWASAPTKRRASRINHPSQRRRAERLRQRKGGRGGNRGRDHPQGVQQRRTIPQSRLRRASSLYTREPCPAGDGGCGLPRRPCGLPRNDNRFLSFRGAERRGNPSFFRWTGDGGSGRRGRRPLRMRCG